jgi:RNA polymerase sigma-70 factor (ECF subfamily)
VDVNCDLNLSADTVEFIRRKARQLAGKYGFSKDEVNDLQQDLTLDYLQRRPHFNELRGSDQGFARSIVRHRVATLIESQKAQRRGYGIRHYSLSTPLDSVCPDSPLFAEIASDPSKSVMSLELKIDVSNTIGALPSELRTICLLFMQLEQMTRVGALIGVSRATLHRRMQLIREAFVGGGLHRRRGGDLVANSTISSMRKIEEDQ